MKTTKIISLIGLDQRLEKVEQVLHEQIHKTASELIAARHQRDKALAELLADKDGQCADDMVSDLAAWQKTCEDRVTANFREQLYATERELEFWKDACERADANNEHMRRENKQLREALSAMGQAATTVQDLLKEKASE